MLTLERRVDVENEINSRGCEVGHADIVIFGRVNGINTDSRILDVLWVKDGESTY
jgi:hypothetical protein